MHQSDGDGILTAERALAWGIAIPAIADNDDDVEVPLMQYEVEAVTFQRGAYWAKVAGCDGFAVWLLHSASRVTLWNRVSGPFGVSSRDGEGSR